MNLLRLDNAILKLKQRFTYFSTATLNDLNPMDYAVWGALQEMVYHRRSYSVQ